MSDIAAILLAAGRGSRFGLAAGETKLAAPLKGQPMVRSAAEAALASRAYPVSVVTGHAAEKVEALLRGLDLCLVHNPDYAEGLSTSLKAGVAALEPRVKGAVILLADMPFVTRDIIDALISGFEAAASVPDAVVPIREGVRGNPVLLGRSLFDRIGSLQGDRGARALFQEPGVKVLECPIEDAAIALDFDTQEALAAFEAARPSKPD